MSDVLQYLDCGCAIMKGGGRSWCPSCSSPPAVTLPEDAARTVIKQILQMCDEEAHSIDGSLPDAFGGRFAKKFAANSLRGLAGKIRQRYKVEE